MTKIETTRHKNIEILAIFFNIFCTGTRLPVSFSSTYFSNCKFWEKLESVRLPATSTIVRSRWSRFHRFLVNFWFVFDAGSASKTKPKCTSLWYGFGSVLVVFWYGLNPNQNQTDICAHARRYGHNNVMLCTIFF